jgi:branched-chain amino acid aminotransferase
MANSWLDGRLVEGKIPLDPSDRGLILGDGLFETIAVFNRNPAYLGAHLDRLANGAEQLGIEVSRAFIESGVFELLADHGVPNGILRITITRGSGARGLASPGSHATVLITLSAWQRGR